MHTFRRPFTLAVILTFAGASLASAQQAQPAPQADGTVQGGQAPAKPQTPPAAPKPPAPKDEKKPEDQKPTYEETVVVSASKTEQQLVNAPATMTVIGSKALEAAPSSSYADVLREVPGVNVSQISARDINITTRASSGSLATSQLTVLDGRSLYQDFFGFTMWDFMPSNTDEIKRIEVIRGPASAIWGANALNGVVNVITKTPREMEGETFSMGFGDFQRNIANNGASDGRSFFANGSYAHAVNSRWAYKLSAGYAQQDALPRPVGVINGSVTGTSYPAFTNLGTKQPKVDFRADYDAADKKTSMSFSGGAAQTSGIMHSGIGPFSINNGATMSYGKFVWRRAAMHLQVFGNFLNGNAANLLTVDQTGSPILFAFNTKTIDTEFGDTRVFNDRNAITYGGNLRINKFHLTIAPGETSRTEGGGYVQDEMVINDHFRVVAGGRVDKFTSIANAVFSPRVAFLMKPDENQTIRLSYNRAFRAPSMVNDNLQVTIANPFPLAALNPAFGSAVFLVPTYATGNKGLTEEHLDAYELGYSAIVRKRTTLSAAFYYNKISNDILFTETALWPVTTPPPGWALGPLAWGAVQTSAKFPMSFTYLNLGRETNKGLELGVDSNVGKNAAVFANYSFQAKPAVNFDPSEANLPPKNRFNAGASYSDKVWVASMSVSAQASAFWTDVLDARFHGTTKKYTMVNASAGKRFDNGHYTLSFKAVNLFNQEIMQHIFGDVLKRQLTVELHVNWMK